MRFLSTKSTIYRLTTRLTMACLLAGFCNPATGAKRSWISGNGDWNNPTNWSSNSVPGAGDAAFIGNVGGIENDRVSLTANEDAALLQVTDGMAVRTQGNLLEVAGDVLLSGSNVVDPVHYSSTVVANDGFGSTVLSIGGDLNLVDDGTLSIRDQSRVIVGGRVDIGADSAIRGEGELWLTGNGAKSLINDGVIDPTTGGMTIIQAGSGLIDLDGNTGNGRLAISAAKIDGTAADNLTVVGTELSDAFNGEISIADGGFLSMILSNGWTAGVGSEITMHGFPGDNIDPGAKIRESHVTFAGELIVNGSDGLGIIEADTTFAPTATVQVGTDDTLRVTGEAQIDGGEFNLNEDALLRFQGPTTVKGGTFNTFSTSPGDGNVRFVGETDWSGEVSINGLVRQIGDANVTGPTTINGGVFDLDGSGNTEWNIGNSLNLHVDRIDSTANNRFDGTMNVGAGFFGRLNIDLAGPSPQWEMAGEMNLSTVNFIPFSINRVIGSKMVLSGDLNGSGKVGIGADTDFTSESTTTLTDAGDQLSMSGVTQVMTGAQFIGDGLLLNKAAGHMTLEDGVSTDDVGLVNDGLLDIDHEIGIVAVDRFENQDDGTLAIDLAGHLLGDEFDHLMVAGTAQIDGTLSVSLMLDEMGEVIHTPQLGDEYMILTSLGGVSGMFAQVLPTIAEGMVYGWEVLYHPHDITIRLDTIGAVVPEPASVGLLLLAACSVSLRRSRPTRVNHRL